MLFNYKKSQKPFLSPQRTECKIHLELHFYLRHPTHFLQRMKNVPMSKKKKRADNVVALVNINIKGSSVMLVIPAILGEQRNCQKIQVCDSKSEKSAPMY